MITGELGLLGLMLLIKENVGVQMVTNIGPTIRPSASLGTLMDKLSITGEGADGQILLRVKDMVLNGAPKVMIHTVDSNVLMIVVTFYFILK